MNVESFQIFLICLPILCHFFMPNITAVILVLLFYYVIPQYSDVQLRFHRNIFSELIFYVFIYNLLCVWVQLN